MNEAIDLWLLREAKFDAELEAVFWASMGPSEKAKALRYRRDVDRRRCVAARGLLRHALSQRCREVAPESWQIELEESGRPYVAHPRPFSVTISHTPGGIVVALASALSVGVDIEAVGRTTDFDQVARRWYTPLEREELAGLLDDAQRRRRFFRYWVLKEAYAKARGLGLAIGLDRIRFPTDEEGRILLVEDDVVTPGWGFELREVWDDFLVAVAADTETITATWNHYAER